MSKKRVFLITGASGFIGSCLARRLVNTKAEVHLILRQQSDTWRINDILNKTNIHICNLTNLTKLKKIISRIKPTVIYHLAAYGAYSCQDDANKILKNNIWGTWNLLQAVIEQNFELFVNTGSSSEYGFKKNPMQETDLLEPASYYAVTKCTQTHLCALMAKMSNKSIVTLRLASVYGPYEQPTRFIPTLMKCLYLGKKMDLVAPNIAHDYIYIDDVVAAYLKNSQLKKYPGRYFNIGTGVQSSIKQAVETATGVTKRTTHFNWNKMSNRSWDTTSWKADISLAKKLLHWQPKVNLADGLKLTWNWFNKYKKFYI